MCFSLPLPFFHIPTSKSGPNMVRFAHFELKTCFSLQRRANFRAIFPHPNFQKRSENGVFLYILTCKCASRCSTVPFFDIATSKSGPNMVRFAHFDFEMCFSLQRRAIFPHPNFQEWSENDLKMRFAPQRRAIFQHPNFQTWYENGVFCAF